MPTSSESNESSRATWDCGWVLCMADPEDVPLLVESLKLCATLSSAAGAGRSLRDRKPFQRKAQRQELVHLSTKLLGEQ